MEANVHNTGSCHCGKVRIQILVPLSELELKEDNCSSCVRVGSCYFKSPSGFARGIESDDMSDRMRTSGLIHKSPKSSSTAGRKHLSTFIIADSLVRHTARHVE